MVVLLCITAAALAVFYAILCWKHMRVKRYFWHTLSNREKVVIDYIGHRNVIFVNDVPWAKKERRFLEERNRVLIAADPCQAEALIRAERNLCRCEYLLMLMLFLFLLAMR